MAAVWHLSSGYRRSTVIGVDDASAHLCAVQGIHGSSVAFANVDGEAGQAGFSPGKNCGRRSRVN
jgi:hypothetical protein